VIARSPVMLKVRRERRKAREVPAGIQVYFEETDRRFAARSRTLSTARKTAPWSPLNASPGGSPLTERP
jgi:hypothetical protein